MVDLVFAETNTRSGQERRRDQAATNSDTDGLDTLKHFGLDPKDGSSAAGGAVFEPCDDTKTCLSLSHIIDAIDNSILKGHVECRSVDDCDPGECRLTNKGLKCDVPGKLYCNFPCVDDDY